MKKFYDFFGKYIIFFLLFNLVFILLAFSIKYAFPFILSLLMTVWLYPVANYIHKKTHVNRNIVNILCILTSIFILIFAVSLISLGIIGESKEAVNSLKDIRIDVTWITTKIESLKKYIEKLSPEILNSVIDQLQTLASNIGGYLGRVGNWLIALASTIPSIVITVIITIISTFFLMRDYSNLAKGFENFKIGNNNQLPKKILIRSYSIIVNYIQSYSVLLTITFIESIIVFKAFGITYAFTLAILCVLLDILPIVGIAIVFFSLATIYVINGQTFLAIIIICIYAGMVVIRNIIEPKLLSKSLQLHPVIILMCLYIGIKLGGIMGIIYCVLLVSYFKLLKEVEMI